MSTNGIILDVSFRCARHLASASANNCFILDTTLDKKSDQINIIIIVVPWAETGNVT